MDTGAHTFTHPHAQALSRALQNEDQMKEMTHLPAFLLLGNLLPHLAPPSLLGRIRQTEV